MVLVLAAFLRTQVPARRCVRLVEPPVRHVEEVVHHDRGRRALEVVVPGGVLRLLVVLDLVHEDWRNLGYVSSAVGRGDGCLVEVELELARVVVLESFVDLGDFQLFRRVQVVVGQRVGWF